MVEPRAARVGFSTAKGLLGLVSRVIRWASGSKASHVWILYWDPVLEVDTVFEAHLTEVRRVPLPFFERDNNIVAVVQPEFPIEVGIPPVARELLGAWYDYAGLFGMIAVVTGRLFKAKWRNPFRSSKAQFCAELVTRVLQAAEHPGTKELDPECVTPQDLFLMLGAKER